MGCAVGACLGCVVMGSNGMPQRVCREGPVFAAEEWPGRLVVRLEPRRCAWRARSAAVGPAAGPIGSAGFLVATRSSPTSDPLARRSRRARGLRARGVGGVCPVAVLFNRADRSVASASGAFRRRVLLERAAYRLVTLVGGARRRRRGRIRLARGLLRAFARASASSRSGAAARTGPSRIASFLARRGRLPLALAGLDGPRRDDRRAPRLADGEMVHRRRG